MDILIPDQWLREYLETKASPKQIMEYLSLCGPSVEKIIGEGKETTYAIEVTTNRVDTASVYGIAREAAAILPRFEIAASLSKFNKRNIKFSTKVDYLTAWVDKTLCQRFSAILIRDIKISSSPKWMAKRLELAGERPINNIVDISNYIMHELGQPVHTFDYDKIGKHTMKLRASKKGETITTLDGKTHRLPGGDIVIEDGEGKLIDLAGIMGAENSAISKHTKNVLLFVQTYSPNVIRKTSMRLAHRTNAATLFEKGLDTEGVLPALSRGVDLLLSLAGGKAEKIALDIYPSPYKSRTISVELPYLQRLIGVKISKQEVSRILSLLSFSGKWKGDSVAVSMPSFRADDIQTREDILEEVARIYGYFSIPSTLPPITPGDSLADASFEFEMKVKNYLSGWGGMEVYTSSLVSSNEAGDNAIAISNPLGSDTSYLRTSLLPSLLSAVNNNRGKFEKLHIFEISNVYLQKKNGLPEERRMLSGVFSGYTYRNAKGVIEALFAKLHVPYGFKVMENGSLTNLEINSGNTTIGELTVSTEGEVLYEIRFDKLRKHSVPLPQYKEPAKFPAQIEDITFTVPEGVYVSDILAALEKASKLITRVELVDTYENNYTFRINYQHPDKTLTNTEVEKLRKEVIVSVEKRGAVVKT